MSAEFKRAFDLVMEAFMVSAEEREIVKATARACMVAAEDAFYADAAMLRAGWKPLEEQAAAFIKRTAFQLPRRWPITSTEHVEIQWPERRMAA